jgi:DNA polymerase III gamma/tau subunit
MTGETRFLAELPADTVAQMQRQAQRMPQTTTLYAIKRFSSAIAELKNSHQPQLPLELALIETIQGEATPVVMATAIATPAVATAPAPTATVVQPTPTTPPVTTSAAVPALNGETAAQAPPVIEEAPLDEAAIKRLHQQWDSFKKMVRDKSGVRVQAAINTVRDIAVADQTVAFAFGNNQFTRDMVAEPETLGDVAALLSKVLGRAVRLECQMGEKATLTNMVHVQEVQTDGEDPLVEYAVATLGAEVVT